MPKSTNAVRKYIDMVQRFQFLELEDVLDAAAKLPPGVLKVEFEDWSRKDLLLRTIRFSVSNKEALEKLDLKKIAKNSTPEVAEAARLLKENTSFEPRVINRVANILPHGMISMTIGDEPGSSAGIIPGINNNNNNYKCKKKDSSSATGATYWPISLEVIESL